jgi:hypothetical protein
MATKNQFFRLGKFSIRVGSEIRFWEHKWLGTTTLRDQYPALYNIIHHKGDTIAKVMASSPPDVTFRRDLSGLRLVDWQALLQCWRLSISKMVMMCSSRAYMRMDNSLLAPCTVR